MHKSYSARLRIILWLTNLLFIAYPLLVVVAITLAFAGVEVARDFLNVQLALITRPTTAWLPQFILVMAFLTAILDACLLIERLSYVLKGRTLHKSALAIGTLALIFGIILPILLTVIGPTHFDFNPNRLAR